VSDDINATQLHAMNTTQTRRRFLQTTAAATAALEAFWTTRSLAAPSERVRIAYIGCGGRARQMMPMFKSHPEAEVVAVSDVNEPRMDQAMQLLAKEPNPQRAAKVVEYERILERKDVDAVVIATTQHWHGLPHLHACQAGKHIFVEKPLSHTIVEGRAMVEATKKAGVIALMGTQQRAGSHYQKAVELVRSGRLGTVALVTCWNYHNTGNRVGHHKDADPPAGLHWDHWLGPAPWVPFNPGRLNNSWWFDYGGGMMTNWAIHHLDIILWAMQASHPSAVTCAGGKFVVDDMADTPDTIQASWTFPGWLMQYEYRGFNNWHAVQDRPNHHGICFHGNQATLVLDRSGYQIWDDGSPGKVAEKVSGIPYFSEADPLKSEQDGPWHRLFIDCVKGRQKLPLNLEASHRATVCCHLANIAYRTKRNLQWDGAREKIVGDAEAGRLLDRLRRKGYELPRA
jgi:predicted dehydrogenase